MPAVRWGLAAKLFATLILLGAVAILVTAVLGYVRSRDALEAAILNQLTAARQNKASQIESYFRTIRNELRVLAASKMVIDATRGFHDAIAELEDKPVSEEMRRKVDDWYEQTYMPIVRRLLDRNAATADYVPRTPAAVALQHAYLVANPNPPERRRLLNDAGDGSAYSALHATYHPLLRAAASTLGFTDFLVADTRTTRMIYGMAKEVDFGISLNKEPFNRSTLATVVARCAGAADPSLTCLEDFAAYLPADGTPAAFMAAPVIDHGVVTGVLVAQLSIQEIDRVVTGGRRWRQEGFGDTGEAYLIGPDMTTRSGVRLFYENRDAYFAELRASGHRPKEIDAIRRYDSPVLHQRIDTLAIRAALTGIEGTGPVVGNYGKPTLASWGPLDIPGVNWALVAKIETSEAFAPIRRLEQELLVVGAIALLVIVAISAWLARSLAGPLTDLTAGVRRFASGDYDVKVSTRSQDEIGQLCAAFNSMVDDIHAKNDVIEAKSREIEELLLNVLPAPIANRLRAGEQSIADGFAEVSVAFADLVGFTALSSEMPPQEVVALLNGLFTRFDQAAQELGIEKIKTVGDAYMAVCGLPTPVENHAERMVRMAIRMVHICREHALEHRVPFRLRIGINSGPVVAGVIGKSKYIYDLWGDTVNLASRMESAGLADAIQVTRPVYEQLKDKFTFEPRGALDIKGKGQVEAWVLRV